MTKLEYNRLWRKNNQFLIRQYRKKFALTHPDYQRRYQLYTKFGITETQYNELALKQENKCVICGDKSLKKNLNVDHNHKTKKIRGLLCINCNVGLGNFKDSKDLLLKALDYLTSHDA